MPCCRIRVHYEHLSEFDIIGLEAGWEKSENRSFMDLSDGAIRRCWQEWVHNGRFQRHDGSGRSRFKSGKEDILIAISAVTATDLSLSTSIRRAAHTRVSTMTIHRRLKELNLHSYRPLRHLPDYSGPSLEQVGIMLPGDL
ncbi:HTH_Tnp_Tc3_2 domain-containing protein [Trichonephila clavipes]|nr:HTH_Tnp_Tc3_2 domain-containing protein [Trichonephila clavipes]